MSSVAQGMQNANSAYVYISTPAIAGAPGNFISGYTADANGKLTAIPGSPFKTAGQAASIAANGKYLLSAQGTNIVSYSIGASGAPAQVATLNVQQYDKPSTSGFPAALFTDRNSETVYDEASAACNLSSCYQAFALRAGGSLSYIGTPDYSNPGVPYLSFTADDHYAYGSDFVNGDRANFYGFVRDAQGGLTYFNPHANLPAPAAHQMSYLPYGAAVPDDEHVVVALQNGGQPDPGDAVEQLAVYTIDAAGGDLTTADTAASMPDLAVGYANHYRFDPTGQWLAAGGAKGVQIFAFRNGQLISTGIDAGQNNETDELAWDNAGHLYALGKNSGLLFVYDVTNGVPTPAAGSPYTIPIDSYLAVQPLP
jgi:hypothetical protein